MATLFASSKLEDFLRPETIQNVQRLLRAEYDESKIPVSENKWNIAKVYVTSMLIGADVIEILPQLSNNSAPLDLFNCVKHLRKKFERGSNDEIYIQEKKAIKKRAEIVYGGISDKYCTPMLHYRNRTMIEEIAIETLNKAAECLSRRDFAILSKLVQKYDLDFFCCNHERLIRFVIQQNLLTEKKLVKNAKQAAIVCLKRIANALIESQYPLVERIDFSCGGQRESWQLYRLQIGSLSGDVKTWFRKAIRIKRESSSYGKPKEKKYLQQYSRFLLKEMIRKVSDIKSVEQFDTVKKAIAFFKKLEPNRSELTIKKNVFAIARLIRDYPPKGSRVISIRNSEKNI